MLVSDQEKHVAFETRQIEIQKLKQQKERKKAFDQGRIPKEMTSASSEQQTQNFSTSISSGHFRENFYTIKTQEEL